MNHLTLYYKPTCPYCQKVLGFMDQNGISVPLKNREETPRIRQELVDIGGKPQVPCLIIDGKALYESDDIIQWFKKNWKKE
ncbi:MAG: glutaredoxin [Omnitrophica WOR_2 bacterium RIFCSPHIGHO2_01_FULL_52_10]|nr:MAG: glutaredoxin [Omnitrophica WOR_2 bacterium RIFCSPHIGHO2_01_FULL_52_10]